MIDEPANKISHHARHKARRLLVQALYQWQVSGGQAGEIAERFLIVANPKKVDCVYFKEILLALANEVEALDAEIKPFLDREISSLDQVELAVLRLAVYELARRPDLPYRVVIDEALKLTKIFGSVDGYKYVNGVLDKIAKKLRDEV